MSQHRVVFLDVHVNEAPTKSFMNENRGMKSSCLEMKFPCMKHKFMHENNISMHKNDISMHEKENNFCPQMFMDESSMQ